MYKHWEVQRNKVLELISRRQGATCQVCYGTNYSIFFRNLHSDLLLKKNILPVYIDLNNLRFREGEELQKLIVSEMKKTLIEKKLGNRYGEPIDTKSQIEKIINEARLRNIATVFFFEDADEMLHNPGALFGFIESLNQKEKCVAFYLTKTNLSHPNIKEKLAKFAHVFQNVLYFQVRDKKFMKVLEKGTSPKIFGIIYSLTGGVDRFHNIAVDLKNNLSFRERKNVQERIMHNWNLKRELSKMWDHFSESEKETLSRIVHSPSGKAVSGVLVYDLGHLLNLNILKKTRKGYEFVVGMLRQSGFENSADNRVVLDYNRGKVFINGNLVRLKLTHEESSILKNLIQNKNRIVGKTTIARAVWNGGHLKKTKDGSIDKTINKLKGKLTEVWVNPDKFVSIEGRGYIYKESL